MAEEQLRVQALSTRDITLSTGERYRFAPEALIDMLAQVRANSIPMVAEHLHILPPMGRWFDGEVVTADDGEQDLYLLGEPLRLFRLQAGEEEKLTSEVRKALSTPSVPLSLAAEFRLEGRNFDDDVLAELTRTAPLPVKEEHRWAALPPLEWIIAVPVVWGATRFAGSFFDTLGTEAAKSIVDWIKRFRSRSRESDRHALVTVSFELPGSRTVLASYVLPPEGVYEELALALNRVGSVAEFVGAHAEAGLLPDLRRACFLYSEGRWRLAWIATEDSAFYTKWFEDHPISPSRFLGHPSGLLPDPPAKG